MTASDYKCRRSPEFPIAWEGRSEPITWSMWSAPPQLSLLILHLPSGPETWPCLHFPKHVMFFPTPVPLQLSFPLPRLLYPESLWDRGFLSIPLFKCQHHQKNKTKQNFSQVWSLPSPRVPQLLIAFTTFPNIFVPNGWEKPGGQTQSMAGNSLWRECKWLTVRGNDRPQTGQAE